MDASGGFGAGGGGVVVVVVVGVVDGVVDVVVVLAASDISGIRSNAPTTKTPIVARKGKTTLGAVRRPWVPLNMPD